MKFKAASGVSSSKSMSVGHSNGTDVRPERYFGFLSLHKTGRPKPADELVIFIALLHLACRRIRLLHSINILVDILIVITYRELDQEALGLRPGNSPAYSLMR